MQSPNLTDYESGRHALGRNCSSVFQVLVPSSVSCGMPFERSLGNPLYPLFLPTMHIHACPNLSTPFHQHMAPTTPPFAVLRVVRRLLPARNHRRDSIVVQVPHQTPRWPRRPSVGPTAGLDRAVSAGGVETASSMSFPCRFREQGAACDTHVSNPIPSCR